MEHGGLSTGRRAAVNESACVSVRLQVREILDATMRRVVQTVTGNAPQTERVLNGRADLTQFKCYSTVLRHYRRICFNWHQPEVQTPRAPEAASAPHSPPHHPRHHLLLRQVTRERRSITLVQQEFLHLVEVSTTFLLGGGAYRAVGDL